MSFILLGILNSQAEAAGGGSAFDLLSTTLITTNTSTITFNSLGSYSGYKHLQIRATIRSTRSSGEDVMTMRINGNTGSNYARHALRGDGGSVTTAASTSQTYIRLDQISDGGETANTFDAMVLDILDFGNASTKTTVRSLKGKYGTNRRIQIESGLYNVTEAVTSLSFSFALTGENFVPGTRFSLYGYK